MAIKMRRGADADFRPEKMQPGELAVTVDGTRKVYAAFAAGDVKELSSKEDVDKTIASGLQSLETSTNNKLQSLEKKASSAVDKISSENQRVQEELSRYEYYTKTESDLKYTVAPRKEASSANGELKLTDADYGLSYLELQGNSEQYTNTASANLFDAKYNKSLGLDATDKYLRTTGEIDISVGWSYSYYIKVVPNTLYSFVGIPASPAASFVFYTKDKTYISGISTKDAVIDLVRAVTTPNNCEWMRISYGYNNQIAMYLGQPPSQGVMGAVDTPSPEYPSEVKSVGDIPKDSNGVEIRNIIDIDGILARPESDWTVSVQGRTFSIPLDVSKQKIGGRLFEAISNPRFNLGLSLSSVSLSESSGFYLSAPSVPYKSFDFSVSPGVVYLFIYITGSDQIDLAMVKEILDKERNKFVFTYASEVDEYRPYIGENNGLVKMESASKNLFNPQVIYNMKPTAVVVSGDTVIIDNVSELINKKLLSGKFKENTQYTLSVYSKRILDNTSIGDGNFRFRAVFTDGTGQDLGMLNYDNYTYVKATTVANKTIDYIIVNYNQAGIKIWLKELQLEEGIQATEYRPYKEQITWIPLREPLRGLPDGRVDTIDRDGNVIQYIDRSGIEQYPIAQESDQMFEGNLFRTTFKGGSYVGLAKKDNGVYCNIMKFKQTVSLQYGVSASPLYNVIYFNLKGKLTENTVDLARKFLNDNNAVFYFTLRTPITYQIPAVYTETYEPVTNVRCMNEVKPSDMTLDYKIAMSSLIKRLEALEEKTVQEV